MNEQNQLNEIKRATPVRIEGPKRQTSGKKGENTAFIAGVWLNSRRDTDDIIHYRDFANRYHIGVCLTNPTGRLLAGYFKTGCMACLCHEFNHRLCGGRY